MARKSKKLENIISIYELEEKIEENEIENLEVDKDFILTLKTNAETLTDNRVLENTIHSLESILLTVIFGILANCNTFTEIYLFMLKHAEWLHKHVHYDSGLPSLSTIKRVIGIINPKELEQVCNESLHVFIKTNESYYEDEDIVIKDLKSMDGKTANSSDRIQSKNGEIKKTNAMSIFSVGNNICEATEFINDKTNEIPTGIELLKRVNIEDSIIVFDAMSTQTKTIDYIAKNGGYYVAPVKGNQENLEKDISLYFKDEKNYQKVKGKNYYKTAEKTHGTIETREYLFVNDVDWIYQKDSWKKLKSIGIAKRTYTNKERKEVTDTRYFISNIDANKIELLSKSIRGEWQIENGLHLYLDMVFDEDKNKSFLENSQKNLNIIRKLCLAILKRYKAHTKLSMNSIRFNISMDFENEIDSIIKRIFY